jgi:hypothetical protein
MYAHYFKAGKRHELVISDTNRPIGKTITVASKKDAKQYAKDNNLTPWNF